MCVWIYILKIWNKLGEITKESDLSTDSFVNQTDEIKAT